MSKSFYLLYSFWMIIAVLLGFWPGYFGPMIEGTNAKPLIVHIHAVVYSGWVLLFFIQALLVYKGNTKTHMKWGKIGIYYGGLVLIIGVVMGQMLYAYYVDEGKVAEARFSGSITIRDMLFFLLLFALAVYYRKNSRIHRVWILGATNWILIAAIGRLSSRLPGGGLTFYTIWLFPILVAMLLDLRRRKSSTLVYILLLAILMVGSFLQPFFEELIY